MGRRGYTLLQVRATAKPESPACFDLPAAGRVLGLETAEQALGNEHKEELDLELQDILHLHPLARYTCLAPVGDGDWLNVEQPPVLRGTLAEDRLGKTSFADREVAAIAMFAIQELEALVMDFPERAASGLSASLPKYLHDTTATHPDVP